MKNRSTIQAVLRLLGTQGIGPARVRGVMRWCGDNSVALEEFVRTPHVIDRVLKEDLVLRLRAATDPEAVMDKLEAADVNVLLASSEGYPFALSRTLADKAPPVLMVQGSLEVLSKSAVGFCGSRKATERGISTAQDCADQLARRGVNVTSGYAAGVDLTAHQAALKAGGTTTVVLAGGILNFRIKEEIAGAWDWARTAVVSEFFPTAPWSVGHAMQRNATICGLSQAMILIEARSTGGSAEAGRTCVKLGLPLFATVYRNGSDATSGNQDLIREGATQLFKSQSTGRANLEKVFKVVSTAGSSGNREGKQQPVPAVIKTACSS